MKRQIKFRAKILNSDQLIYGYYYCNTPTHEHRIISPTQKSDEMLGWNIDPNTIGQFTGLTDKNGTEIYEGDIIRIDCHPWLDWKELESVNAEVVFENFAIIAQWKNPDAGKSFGFPDDEYVESEYVADILCNLPNTIEIIGNIHENPIEE